MRGYSVTVDGKVMSTSDIMAITGISRTCVLSRMEKYRADQITADVLLSEGKARHYYSEKEREERGTGSLFNYISIEEYRRKNTAVMGVMA